MFSTRLLPIDMASAGTRGSGTRGSGTRGSLDLRVSVLVLTALGSATAAMSPNSTIRNSSTVV